MSNHINKQMRSNQDGIVAIVVAITITIIISLMILAISQNANREQRQALDRQLSDQAFYNAESGINDVTNYLYTTPLAPIDEDKCLSLTSKIAYDLDDPSGTNKYTCLLYNKAPKTIIYDSLSLSSPKVVPIQPVNEADNPVTLASLTLSWDDANDRNASIIDDCNFMGGAPELPTKCDHGGLRLEIVSLAGADKRDTIRQRSFSAFLLPTTSSTTSSNLSISPLSYPDSQGIISPSKCANSPVAGARRCSKTITDINLPSLFLSLRSLYRPVSLTISGKDTNGNEVRFKNTQIVIDSTGKASDVLRRVQVRVPATSQYSYPGFALQSRDSICKVLKVTKDDGEPGRVDQDNTTDVCPSL